MSFDWSEYLKVAHELIGEPTPSSTQEAKSRAGISRAYYAAFNKARTYMEDVHNIYWIPKEGESHQFVINWYKTHPDDGYQQIGHLLAHLRRSRRFADYEAKFGRLRDEARLSLRYAGDVIKLLATLPQ